MKHLKFSKEILKLQERIKQGAQPRQQKRHLKAQKKLVNDALKHI